MAWNQAAQAVRRPVETPAPVALPARVAFVDVETTGMLATDRVVSAAVIVLETATVASGQMAFQYLHVICDPGRPSHPRAEEVHGYDDWVLRHQEPFADNARAVHEAIHLAELIVAHNAGFDLGFLGREFEAAGLPAIAVPSLCTMRAWRRVRDGSASLTAAAGQIGYSRAGQRHGALEDAWLAMAVYLHLHGHPMREPFSLIADPGPANYREPPRRPEGDLPRRQKAGGGPGRT